MKKYRTCVTINVSKEFKQILQEVADENRRSLSSQLVFILEEYLKQGK